MAIDRFVAAGNLVMLENKNKTINSISVVNCKTAYGAMLIHSKHNEKQYTWKIKIDSFGTAKHQKGVDIGIQDSKLNTLQSEFYPHTPAYCFQSVGKTAVNGKLEITADVFEKNDIVTVQLDMKRQTIKYLVNNEDKGVIITGIKQKDDLQYRLAVTLRGTATVTLIDFQVHDHDASLTEEKLNNDDIFDRYDQLQNEMLKKIASIENYKNEISELNKKLISLQEVESKLDDNDDNGIDKIWGGLENELNTFKQQYNAHKLQAIFEKSADNLINKESSLNKRYIKYKQTVDKIVVSSQTFSKYIQDVGQLINKISKPDPETYKSWNIKQILIWIQGLENGRFKKHIDKLKCGFEKSEIIGEDLPDLTRSDLSSQPFDIGNFRDRKQLEMHFQSLKTSQPGHTNQHIMDEGVTAYI